jgi:archaemetzincin
LIGTCTTVIEMRHNLACLLFVLFACLISVLYTACSAEPERPELNVPAEPQVNENVNELHRAMTKIEPFFLPMGKPQQSDWLASHNEPGQTFDEYLASSPTKPSMGRSKIYILPIGVFTPPQRKVARIVEGYLAAFFGFAVSEMPAQNLKRPLSVKDFRLVRPNGLEQIRTGYILDSVLKPVLPADAAALIAFTAADLYPDASMNYVFGQASFQDRVGVWSLSRLNDAAKYDTFLRRTLKIAAHETGHMFAMRHCKKYECVMSGTNHLGETDRRPIDACPECTAKICWLTDSKLSERYSRLETFCRNNGLKKEADDFRRKAAALKF